MSWWRDLRYGLRLFWRTPVIFVAAIVSLALGIGANSAVFSMVDALLLRSAPGVDEPERLVAVFTSEGEAGIPFGPSSYVDYEYFRDNNDAFAGLAAFKAVDATLRGPTETEVVEGALVSENYFDVLGVRLLSGRTFDPEETEAAGAGAVVVLSHGLWQRRFGEDPNVIGREIGLNGRAFTVIGVAPPEFRGTNLLTTPSFWVPIQMQAHFMPSSGFLLDDRGWRGIHLIGRLSPEAESETATANLRTLMDRLRGTYPDTHEEREVHVTPAGIARTPPGDRGFLVRMSGLLLAIVALVLFMACVNLANVLLARANARRRELSIRIAMGASRLRLARQLVVESLGMGLLGGAVGLLVAAYAMPALESLFSSRAGNLTLGIDLRVVLFTLGLSLIVSVAIALAPAVRATRGDVTSVMKEGEATSTGSAGNIAVRNALVVAEISVSLVLLVGAMLFLRTLVNLQATDFGFQTDNLVAGAVPLPADEYEGQSRAAFYTNLLDRVEALPEVAAASAAHLVPLSGDLESLELAAPDRQAEVDESVEVGFTLVDHRYFEVLDIPLLRGRAFEPLDRQGSPPVTVINRTLAERLWPEGEPIGKRVDLGHLGESVEVIGVVENSLHVEVREDPRTFLYLPYLQHAHRPLAEQMNLLAKSQGQPEEALSSIRREVRSLDPDVPVDEITPFPERIAHLMAPQRLAARLLAVFGLMGLCLTAVGIYAVISYFVSQRTREIGVRIALGAQRRQVFQMIFRRGSWLVLAGLVIGVIFAAALSRLVTSLLFGVAPMDPMTYIAIPLVIILIAIVAIYLPARRAAAVEPHRALRYE